MTELHPAAAYIGRPYRRGAQGPEEFDCWSWVRFLAAELLGIAMPPLVIGAEDNTADNRAAIRQISGALGWQPTGDRVGLEHDIVVMQTIIGPHVGMLLHANGALGLSHCVEGRGVSFQPLTDLQRQGYHGLVYWRRQA